jgi:uncharacterized membrane protein
MARSDVVGTLLGASAGLAGLTLVFLGVIVTAFSALAVTASPRVLERYRRPALAVLATFALCLSTVVCCAGCLLAGGNGTVYACSLVLFFAQLAALGGCAALVMRRVMWP